jgi:hypothetical protein
MACKNLNVYKNNIDSFLEHRFKKLNKLKKSNILKFELTLVFKLELVVSFRQCKDVARKKRYSVISYLISVVNICKRL